MSHGSGGTTLNVTTANTTVTGTVNLETINALAANDTLIAGPGYEYLNAGGANDTLEGAIGSATFTGLSGSSNTTLIALPSLTATVAGVEVDLGISGLTSSGVTVTGTDFVHLAMTHQVNYLNSTSNIKNVVVDDNGDNVVWGVAGSTIVVNGDGTNEIWGRIGGSTIIVNGTGNSFIELNGGVNTATGSSGQNDYLFNVGPPATKHDAGTPATYFSDTITNFNVANDKLEFQFANRYRPFRCADILDPDHGERRFLVTRRLGRRGVDPHAGGRHRPQPDPHGGSR